MENETVELKLTDEELKEIKEKEKIFGDDDDFLKNNIVDRNFINKKFKGSLSYVAFNEFKKENNLILNRINKKFLLVNENILKNKTNIDEFLKKTSEELYGFNKNTKFQFKDYTNQIKKIINDELKQTTKQKIILYSLDLLLKLFLMYVLMKAIMLDVI